MPKEREYKKPAIPKTLAGIVDLFYKVRAERLAEDRYVNDIKEFENELKRELINQIPKSEATGVAGKVARATIVKKDVESVRDWDAFYAYMQKNKAWDLLQRRVNSSALKARRDAKKPVPGTEVVAIVDVSITKIPAKK